MQVTVFFYVVCTLIGLGSESFVLVQVQSENLTEIAKKARGIGLNPRKNTVSVMTASVSALYTMIIQ